MAVETRPTDNLTVDYLQLGMPFIEYAPLQSSGAYGPYRNLGIIDNGELAKAIETVQLNSSQSGIARLQRELVRSLQPSMTIGLFQHSPENLQLIFGSATRGSVSSGTATATDDSFQLTDDYQDFVDLSHRNISESITAVSAAEVADESVGTGAGGTTGETLGDFALDYKVNAVGDITEFLEGGTDRTADLIDGSSPTAGQIGVTTGSGADSGKLIYPSGEAPADGAALVATYEPSFALVENTDFVVDYKHGRIRFLESLDGATDKFRSFQPMEATYDYEDVAHETLTPFTQTEFTGRLRLRLLTDVGINIIWPIPSVSIRLTDDAFMFNRDDFQVSNLAIQLLDAGGSAPYGTMQVYAEQ